MAKTKLSLFGSRGLQVKKDQKALNLAGAKLKVDGKFGPKTQAAALEFQKEHGLYKDGVIGPITRYELMFYKYPHFKKEEFKCNCGGKYCNGYPVKVSEGLLILLEKIRKECGNKSVHLNRGISCKKYNATIKGAAKDSQHLYGTAADIYISGISVKNLGNVCKKLNPKGGVGSNYDAHVHVDVRGVKARW
ncbi:MAG: D-Ala-D-Ala carboxypeptidase family metallohydrolase [Eubacteriaceae bacterium]